MKLTTIWSLPGLPFRERLDRTADWAAMKVAARLPKRVAYWSYIMSGSKAIRSDEIVPDARFAELLTRIPRTRNEVSA